MRKLFIPLLALAWASLHGVEPAQPASPAADEKREVTPARRCHFAGDVVTDWEKIPAKIFILADGRRVTVAESAVNLIFRSEIISEQYYQRALEFGHVPAGPKSGITVGVGFDLGHQTPEDIRRLLKGKIDDADVEKLCSLAGLRGDAAKVVFEKMEKVKVPLSLAKELFVERVLPAVVERTAHAYPQVTDLPPESAGALVSLVFNRGGSLTGSFLDELGQDRRQGMANIRALLSQGKLDDVSGEILNMKALVLEKERGLLARRDAEAALFQKGVESERRRLLAELERLESKTVATDSQPL